MKGFFMEINGKTIDIPETGLSTEKMRKIFEVDRGTVQKFAQKYGVSFSGEGFRKNYHFFERDIINFVGRPKRGRRWK
jgi:hypothetical protein